VTLFVGCCPIVWSPKTRLILSLVVLLIGAQKQGPFCLVVLCTWLFVVWGKKKGSFCLVALYTKASCLHYLRPLLLGVVLFVLKVNMHSIFLKPKKAHIRAHTCVNKK